ncbi:hypothetical protein TUM4630_28300 [Shewanella algidipiscicola]|uniref:Winged helix-turn helix domain-containing protein n=1 Tax=Shewanella algidipiscicola TaxID=614070 RepID=A0ABQ4PMJ8_9GAMM|nr:hypothetical protein TUM4630_28300 [Shewanella algidipiscicola]
MSVAELEHLAKKEKRSRIKVRYLAICHFLEGKSRTEIARYLRVARGSVNKWVTLYLTDGIDSLKDTPNPGRPSRLTPQQLESVAAFVKERSSSTYGGRLQAKDVGEFIHTQFGVEYEGRNVYRLLHQLGFSWITSRSKHPKQNEEAQRLFKNLPHGNDP